jgi:hypothetical protein
MYEVTTYVLTYGTYRSCRALDNIDVSSTCSRGGVLPFIRRDMRSYGRPLIFPAASLFCMTGTVEEIRARLLLPVNVQLYVRFARGEATCIHTSYSSRRDIMPGAYVVPLSPEYQYSTRGRSRGGRGIERDREIDRDRDRDRGTEREKRCKVPVPSTSKRYVVTYLGSYLWTPPV